MNQFRTIRHSVVPFLSALTVVAVAANVHAAPAAGRERIRIDADWRFRLGDVATAGGEAIGAWQWQPVASGDNADALVERLQSNAAASWQTAKPGEDTFHGRLGFALYRTELPNFGGPNRTLHFDAVDDNATVYLNGVRLTKHEGYSEAFDVPLDRAWKSGGPNILCVLVENTAGPGSIGAAYLQRAASAVATGPAATRFNDGSWRHVHLPHDFVVEGTFTPSADASHGSLPVGVGWYRKTFTIPASDRGRALWIDFDGIYRDSTVWLNGHLLGTHKSGYIGCRYDIASLVNYGGPNTLAVRVDARASEGWWYEGGGIYRHVWLNKANPLHIVPDSVFVSSDVKGDHSDESVQVGLIAGAHRSSDVRVEYDVYDPQGQRVAAQAIRTLVTPRPVATDISIAHPELWSIEHPNLYRLVTRVFQDGAEVDAVSTNFGIRTVRFDAQKGLFLNGKPVKIQGTCNHQDFAGVGIAMPDGLLDWRIRKLKAMGSNAYRCSHNPPAAELLDACDRLGMIVMDETRHLGDTYQAKTSLTTTADDLSDLKDMIRRDRNHPSIIIWSLANEENIQETPQGAEIYRKMRNAVRELDTTRPTSAAMNFGWGKGISLVQDIQGINYALGQYDVYHKAFPSQPVFGSETTSMVSTRGEYVNDAVKGYVSAYSVNAPSWAATDEATWTAIASREFMAGGFVWTGFDYKGEPTPYSWPCVNSHFGIMDMCGFPKDTYYYYKAWWGDKPAVHVFPHWNWPGKEGQPIEVWVHSNADSVELFLNGKSLGTKTMPRWSHLAWQVPYAPGKLEAVGYKDGKRVAADAVETTGKPIRIQLTPDRTRLIADGEDVVPVAVALLDAKGRVVPYADDNVTFAIHGAAHIAGVGNGDPSSHEPDKASQRKAFHGLCMAVVQADDTPGAITLTASAPGLQAATVALSAK